MFEIWSQQVQHQIQRTGLVSTRVDCSVLIICRDRKRKKNISVEFKGTFSTKVRRCQRNAAARVMVITQERNESFMTKVKMFYEDNEPSKTQYFKEGSYMFPRRQTRVRRVPVQWCNAALQPKFARLLQALIYFEESDETSFKQTTVNSLIRMQCNCSWVFVCPISPACTGVVQLPVDNKITAASRSKWMLLSV